MSGDALGLEGLDRVEIGDAQLVEEGEAERAYVYSLALTTICYVTNPDEDLVGLAIDAQPELPDGPGRFDVLNFVAQGYYVPLDPASLTDYARRRRFLDALKARPCADCDGSYPPCVMDFDHRPGVEKVSNVSQLVWKDRALLLAEVAKCDLICSNCHRMRTHHRQHGEAA
jgi:hypothetical protein